MADKKAAKEEKKEEKKDELKADAKKAPAKEGAPAAEGEAQPGEGEGENKKSGKKKIIIIAVAGVLFLAAAGAGAFFSGALDGVLGKKPDCAKVKEGDKDYAACAAAVADPAAKRLQMRRLVVAQDRILGRRVAVSVTDQSLLEFERRVVRAAPGAGSPPQQMLVLQPAAQRRAGWRGLRGIRLRRVEAELGQRPAGHRAAERGGVGLGPLADRLSFGWVAAPGPPAGQLLQASGPAVGAEPGTDFGDEARGAVQVAHDPADGYLFMAREQDLGGAGFADRHAAGSCTAEHLSENVVGQYNVIARSGGHGGPPNPTEPPGRAKDSRASRISESGH